jgi:hypothetical protein
MLIIREFPFASRADDFPGHVSNLAPPSSIFTSARNWDNWQVTDATLMQIVLLDH